MIGCLLLHGFTGKPYEIEPLAKHLRKKTDWEIIAPTLPGHGENLLLKDVTYEDWLEFAEKQLCQLMSKCETVYIIGFSMGGLIAGYLATKYPIGKLVLLSAAVYYINPKQLLMDIHEMIKGSFRGTLQQNELFMRYKKKIIETPFRATVNFRTLVHKIRPALKEIAVPTLIIQGERDGIVPLKSAYFLYETIASQDKKLCLLPTAQHHVCYGADQEMLFNEIDSFLDVAVKITAYKLKPEGTE